MLKNLYYTLIYPFLTYGIIIWGNTYKTTIESLFIIQKRVIRIMTFSQYTNQTTPIFNHLGFIKLHDLVYFQTALFMFRFHNHLLPDVFSNFFTPVSSVHNYNTGLASKSSYVIPKSRTNYGKFSIGFQGAKVWNSIDESLKTTSFRVFKKNMMLNIVRDYTG